MAQFHNHYHLMRMKEMGRIYWCHSIGSFGIALISVFIPIFLLKSGYSFQTVLLFILSQQLLSLILQYPAGKLFAYIRPHHLLALGQFYYVLLLGLLATLTVYHWPLWLLAFMWALNRTVYWTAFHYLFSVARAHKTAGRQIAFLSSLSLISACIAPAIGGIAATFFGIQYAYIVAGLILAIALIPVLKTGGPDRIKLRIRWSHIREIRRDIFANASNGTILMAENNLWPLLIFTIVSSYAGIGLLSAAIALSSTFVTMYVGRREESAGEKPYIRGGLATYSLTSIGRAVVQSSGQIFGLNMLGGIGRSLYVTPFLNRYYANSDGKDRLGYITLMEAAFSAGASLLIILALILSSFVSDSAVLSISLVVVAITALGVRLIR